MKTQESFTNPADGTRWQWTNSSAGNHLLPVVPSLKDTLVKPSLQDIHRYVPGQVIVKYKPVASLKTREGQQISSRLNIQIGVLDAASLTVAGVNNAQLVTLPENMNVDTAVAFYKADPDVEYVQPNYQYSFVSTPNDPNFNEQWGLSQPDNTVFTKGGINAPDAWDITTGSSDVIVALADTGIDYNHPDLSGNIWTNPGETGTDTLGQDKRFNGIDDDTDGFVDDWNGWNFYFNNTDVMDYEGHGTHCAGIIGAAGNNGIGVSGVNWQVKIMPVDISDRNNHADTISAAKGWTYAINHGAKIISNSWGGYDNDPILQEVIANNPDILFVFAAGNDANNNDVTPFYPASYPNDNIISVAAVSFWADGLAGFSNYGYDSVDLAAPGDEILSTLPSSLGSYGSKGGTSMAAPYVSGVAGLIRAQKPDLNAVQIKDFMLQSAEKKEQYTWYVKSGGRLNAYNALRSLSVPVVDFTSDVTSGSAPLIVTFSDKSYANILSRTWDFGEGTTSNEQNPVFTYPAPGSYTVSLTATNSKGSVTTTKTNYITVTEPPASDVGKDWVLTTGAAAFPARTYHSSVVHNGKMWVIGGYLCDEHQTKYHDVWYSSDGSSWTQATSAAAFSPKYLHTTVEHDGKMWVIGGGDFGSFSSDVWNSTDGISWKQATGAAPFLPRIQHASVEYDGKIWVIGGRISGNGGINDVWYSGDGITWTEATGAAAFPSRWGHSVVVYDNKMWVIGGWSGYDAGGILYNDVWYSSDGITWIQATDSTAFTPRMGHSSLMYDNKMWVIGGGFFNAPVNDVWYSTDGITWTQATGSAAFTARDGPSSIVYDGKMWLIGGYWWSAKNDVWNSTLSSSLAIVPFPGCTTPPTDPDHDGIYEDLDGNGTAEYNDVVTFFHSLDWIRDHEPFAAFDFNDNDNVEFSDIVLLYKEIPH